MPNGMSERSVLIEHCGVGGSVRKDTLYPIKGLKGWKCKGTMLSHCPFLVLVGQSRWSAGSGCIWCPQCSC